jgi:hypothetical protein
LQPSLDFFVVQRDSTVDWNASQTEKPPHCYATLIYMAMRSLGKDKVTLGEIYNYVRTHFAYYRANDNGWKNSIRHNLTQHNCFAKVQRTDEHPGKGGYWRLAANHSSMFKNGVFKRKRRKVVLPTSSNGNGVKMVGNGGCGKPQQHSPGHGKKTQPKVPKTEPFVWPGIQPNISILGGCSDMSNADVEVLDGIDWHSMIPDAPHGALGHGSFSTSASQLELEMVMDESSPCQVGGGGGGDSSSSMLSALTLMETPADSPISILPDINQNDGSCAAGSPAYTLHALHNEGLDGAAAKDEFSISQQLKQVESTLDLSGNLSAFEKGGLVGERYEGEDGPDKLAWNGEDLTVRGFGIMILADGIVPDMKMTYKHITPDDLDLDEFEYSAPMPVDWML